MNKTYKGIDTAQIDEIFCEALKQVFYTVSGFMDLEKTGQAIAPSNNKLTALMPMSGEQAGILLLESDYDSIKLLTAYMTGIDFEEITDADVSDCIAELVNMTCGIAKGRFAGDGIFFEFESPFVVLGENVSFVFKNGTIELPSGYFCDDININMKVLLF